MKVPLVNPPWTFESSIYFGCCEPYLPLELAYPTGLLKVVRQEALMHEGHLCGTVMGATQGGRPLALNELEAACWHG